MHKIHISGINIFGVIPLSQFSERAGQVTHVFRETPNSSLYLDLNWNFNAFLDACRNKYEALAPQGQMLPI